MRSNRLCAAVLAAASILAGCLPTTAQPASPPAVPTVVAPTPFPGATPVTVGQPASGNLALTRSVSASASLPEAPAGQAVDGDTETVWSAGGHPTQWIEIDLG
ncbi:MAG: type protein, partial [Anaerolineales bacterium]|nr:type protein [Anaerolineales bacterium]